MASHLDVTEHAVANIKVERDLVAAEWIKSFDLVGGWRDEFTAVARRAIVVEDDFAVEVFEI